VSHPAIAVATMAQMIEIRDEQKRKLGDQYEPLIQAWRSVFRDLTLQGITLDRAAKFAIEGMRSTRQDPNPAIAAFVEESGL